MSSKNPAAITCFVLGLPLLGFGIYFIVWSIINLQFDEYTAFGVLMIIIGAVLLFGVRINQKNDNYLPVNCSIHPDTECAGRCAECGSAFCADCLTEVNGEKYCPNCYNKALEKAREEAEFINKIPLKSKTIALILCLFLWPFGLHMFYLGYSSKGAARLAVTLLASAALVMPVFGVIILTAVLILKIFHAIFDLCRIAGDMPDAYGRKLV